MQECHRYFVILKISQSSYWEFIFSPSGISGEELKEDIYKPVHKRSFLYVTYSLSTNNLIFDMPNKKGLHTCSFCDEKLLTKDQIDQASVIIEFNKLKGFISYLEFTGYINNGFI